MDLNTLFAPQVAQLKQCYADLGYAPQRLQEALKTAIEQEVNRTLVEVDEAKNEVDGLKEQCDAYKAVLTSDGINSITPVSQSDESKFNQGTYFSRIKAWESELNRLKTQYSARRAHVDRLIETLEGYRGILSDFVPTIQGSMHSSPSNDQHISVQPIPSLREVESALSSCTDELHRRTEILQEDITGVAQLWSDLALLPNSDDELDVSIMRHLGIVPRLVDVGEGCMDFCGDFDEASNQERDDENDVLETPSRKSGSQHQLSGNPSLMKPGAILPSLDNLTNVHQRKQELDSERNRRTEMLQTLYDELIPLWQRFDVADEDVDAFVQANCGCTLQVIEAYGSELQQMRELKSQHMALFISKVRQDIASLWDQLMMTADERRDSFAPFFYDLSDSTSTSDEVKATGIEPSDELLALHEEKVRDLQDELATRARPLELVRQYLRLMDEARELEESAKDTSRLTGRGAPGQRRDPGRLLREEKMRKRIKILKPKVEEDLLKTIPAWEEESGRPFVVNGARFLDSVDIQPPLAKKRPRVISNAQSTTSAATTAAAMATPQQNHSTKRAHVEGSASRSVSATNSSAVRKVSVQQNGGAHPTPTMANRGGRNGAAPLSSIPTPSSVSQSQRTKPQTNMVGSNAKSRSATTNSIETSRFNTTINTLTSNSSVSIASQATDATTHVLNIASTRVNSMQPPPLPTPRMGQAAKVRNGSGMPAKRPSMLLEATLRNGPRPSNDFVKPTSTGAGSMMRGGMMAANDSIGPNWAILDDEDEENLLML